PCPRAGAATPRSTVAGSRRRRAARRSSRAVGSGRAAPRGARAPPDLRRGRPHRRDDPPSSHTSAENDTTPRRARHGGRSRPLDVSHVVFDGKRGGFGGFGRQDPGPWSLSAAGARSVAWVRRRAGSAPTLPAGATFCPP